MRHAHLESGSDHGLSAKFDLTGATFAFLGVDGSGTTSPAGDGTVTETITLADGTGAIVFQAEAGAAALYQITSLSLGSHDLMVTPDASSPTFAFAYDALTQTTTITETITSTEGVESLVFASTGGSIALTSDTVTLSNPSQDLASGAKLEFEFGADGTMTETLTRGSHSHSHVERHNPTESLTGLDGNQGVAENAITHTAERGATITTTTFVGDAQDGYALAGTQTHTATADASGPALNLNPFHRVDFDFAHDTVARVLQDGTVEAARTMSGNPHRSFVDLGSAGLAGDFVGVTITHAANEVFQLFYSSADSGGEYMEVARGTGSAASLDLSNIAGQISSLDAIHHLTT